MSRLGPLLMARDVDVARARIVELERELFRADRDRALAAAKELRAALERMLAASAQTQYGADKNAESVLARTAWIQS